MNTNENSTDEKHVRGEYIFKKILSSKDGIFYVSKDDSEALRSFCSSGGWLDYQHDAIKGGFHKTRGCIAMIDGKTIVRLPLTADEQLSICMEALQKIAEVNGPMECSSQSDWRNRAMKIAKKALDESNKKAKCAITGDKP